MNIHNIIRAWKDARYRNTLSDAERAQLPANPAGMIELSDAQLGGAAAANGITIDITCADTKTMCIPVVRPKR